MKTRSRKKTKQATKKSQTGRRFMPRYFRDSYQELKKVTWPSRKEAIKLTFAVIAFSAFFGVFIGIADYIIDRIVEGVFL